MLTSKKQYAIVAPIVTCAALLSVPAAAQATEHYYENGTRLPEEAGPPAKENVAGAHPVVSWGPFTLESSVTGPITCITDSLAYIWNPTGGGAGRAKVVGWNASECKAPSLESLEGHALYVDVTPEFPLKGTAAAVAESAMAGQRRGTSLPWKAELQGPIYNEALEEEQTLSTIGLKEYGEDGLEEPTTCYPAGDKWEELVEPEGANTAAGTLVHGKGCVMLDVAVPELLQESEFFGPIEPTVEEGAANALTPEKLSFHGATEEISSGPLVSQEAADGPVEMTGDVKNEGANNEGQVNTEPKANPPFPGKVVNQAKIPVEVATKAGTRTTIPFEIENTPEITYARTLVGGNAAFRKLSDTECNGHTIAAGNKCKLVVSFTPPVASNGEYLYEAELDLEWKETKGTASGDFIVKMYGKGE